MSSSVEANMPDPGSSSHSSEDRLVCPLPLQFELKISDFDVDEDEDEDVAETPIHPHPLTAFLPPVIFTSHLSAAQKAHQPFPYNMSTFNGITSWAATFLLGSLFFWIQNMALSNYLIGHPRISECRSLVALYVVLLVVEFLLGICSSLYPLIYGCVLRVREGKWPTREKVWWSEGEWETECGADGRRSICIAEYTLLGVLLLGSWRIVRGKEREDEESWGNEVDEKLRLVEEGRARYGEKVEEQKGES